MSRSVEAGDRRTEVVVANLTRSQIVMYAGASGDYNPIHSDEVFATVVGGHPSVFAHGMLTMGMASRAVSAWFGPESVRSFGARFVAQVWPGDTLEATTEVVEVSELGPAATMELALTVRNQRDETVLLGQAIVAVPGPVGPWKERDEGRDAL